MLNKSMQFPPLGRSGGTALRKENQRCSIDPGQKVRYRNTQLFGTFVPAEPSVYHGTAHGTAENRLASIAMALTLSLGLSGCDAQSDTPRNRPLAGFGATVVATDRDTGCQYLYIAMRGSGALTPRLSSDGKPMCSPPATEAVR